MTEIVYQWNPFGDNNNCIIYDEEIVIKVGKSVEYVPRGAPFFPKDFKLSTKSGKVLKLGKDYGFGRPFMDFIRTYNRNLFGTLIVYSHITETDLVIERYSTVGTPFVLDEVEWLEQNANIMDQPRTVNWDDIVGKPDSYPPDPHPQSMYQTYDYEDLLEALTAMIGNINNVDGKEAVIELVDFTRSHVFADNLAKAHKAYKEDIMLGNVDNLQTAEVRDLLGNSNNKLLTVALAKTLIENTLEGTLNIIKEKEENDEDKAEFYTRDSKTVRLLGKGTLYNPLIAETIDNEQPHEVFLYEAIGGETEITLPKVPIRILVDINGLIQHVGYSYSVYRSKVIFVEPLIEGELVQVIYEPTLADVNEELEKDIMISSDEDNNLTLGTDGKLYVNTSKLGYFEEVQLLKNNVRDDAIRNADLGQISLRKRK